MVSLLGVFHKYRNGKGCIACDKKNSNIQVETLESLQSDDIVSFYLGYNSKLRKDKAVLVQKIDKSTSDKALIEKCVKSNLYGVYKPFIVRYLASLFVDEAVRFVLEKVIALTEILAYCGGWVEKKGKCGYEPLVIGKHKSCSICGRLICPKEDCQFCEEGCEGHERRSQSKVIS